MKDVKLKSKIVESITRLSSLGQIPADEKQLSISALYESILDEIVSVVPVDSPRQVVSALQLKYGMPKKSLIRSDDNNSKDVVNLAMMNTVGAMPLDEYGYPTKHVEFETTSSNFIGAYKNIIPGTVKIGDEYHDNSAGDIVNSMGDVVGSVDYTKAIFNVDSISEATLVKYDFNIYNVDTSRNLVYFQKIFVETFAEAFQLDLDVATVLSDFKGLNLKEDIEAILPSALTQQIDNYILSKYFDQLQLPSTHNFVWDDVDYYNFTYDTGFTLTQFYLDFGTTVCMEMGRFAKRLSIVPNIILCDPVTMGILSCHYAFKPLDTYNIRHFNGTPKQIGTFNGAKVFVVNYNSSKLSTDNFEDVVIDGNVIGSLVITYKGESEAQTAGVYTPFIPVKLREVKTGMESGGMITTNNAYSLGGFSMINPDLISGIIVANRL